MQYNTMQYNTIQYNEVLKFWVIKLCLDISDVMQVNEHTKMLIVAHMKTFKAFC